MELHRWVTDNPLTVRQVADLLGVHRVTLHGYMSGKIMPRPANTRAIERLTDGKVAPRDMTKSYNAYWAARCEVGHT